MDDFLTKIREAFHDAFDIDPQLVSIDTAPDDIPEWDSLGHLMLAGSLECTFNVRLDVDDLMEMENVRQIVRILQSKLNLS